MRRHCIYSDKNKRKIIEGLTAQERQMRINAKRMRELDDEDLTAHAAELEGAADITRTWIDGIKQDKAV